MKTLFWMVILLTVCGCSNDETTVYRPHFGPDAAQKETTAAPKTTPQGDSVRGDAQLVEKVGDVDYAAYGIPIYPGAEIKADASLAFKAKKDGPKEIQVTMESIDSVPEIAVWYRDQIKATHALSSADLGTLEGTTETGYQARISIARVEAKSTILFTVVAETPKK